MGIFIHISFIMQLEEGNLKNKSRGFCWWEPSKWTRNDGLVKATCIEDNDTGLLELGCPAPFSVLLCCDPWP